MVVSDPIFYMVAVPAVLLTGASKGGFGSALSGFAVPVMALAISPLQAAGIMLPLLVLTDWVGIRPYWRKWDWTNLKIMIPGGLLGTLLGTLTFGLLSENVIRLFIGLIAVSFSLNALLGFVTARVKAAPAVGKGTFWATVSGYTSFVAHSGGAPAMVYLVPQKLEKVTYVATVNFFFLIVNAMKLVPYAWLGQLSTTNLWTSAVLAPLVPAGVYFGLWLQNRVNQVWFYRVAQASLLLTGANLIFQAARGH